MRQKQLDGLRALAVLGVVAYHHGLLPVGWMGVDLFFVLSGFLITRILTETKRESSYWSQFYVKRAGRILPPLALLLILASVLNRHMTLRAFAGYGLFLGNYVNLTRYLVPMLVVLWSLAIEEHFYIFWPLVIRFLSRAGCIWLSVGVILGEPVLRAVATSHFASIDPIYYLTFFRLDGLVAGSLLALMMPGKDFVARVKRVGPWPFLACVSVYLLLGKIYGGTFSRDANSAFYNSVGYSLVAMGSVLLVAYLVAEQDSPLSRLFCLRPLVFVGELSYGVYLFHLVGEGVLRRVLHLGAGAMWIHATQLLFLANFPLTLLFAWVSFTFLESPIIQWSRHRARVLRVAETVPV